MTRLAEIKRLLSYVGSHISLSLLWTLFLEMLAQAAHLIRWITGRSSLDLHWSRHTLVSAVFASAALAQLSIGVGGVPGFLRGEGLLFSQEMRHLSVPETALAAALVIFSALLMAFFRGPLVFVGYFMAFISYVVIVSF